MFHKFAVIQSCMSLYFSKYTNTHTCNVMDRYTYCCTET